MACSIAEALLISVSPSSAVDPATSHDQFQNAERGGAGRRLQMALGDRDAKNEVIRF